MALPPPTAGPMGPCRRRACLCIFGSAGGLAEAAGDANIDADDSATLHDGGIAAFALQDLSGNRMGTVLSFQRQPGGARLFDFDPGFVYWRWDRDKWGKRFRLIPLVGTVGLGFTDPPRWEITGAYPFNGGTGRALPGVPARGRLWRVSVVDASGKATAQDIYLWRVDGGPIRLQQWYGRPSSIRAAAWLELAAGESLLFEAVEDAGAVDAAADFQVLVLPEAP